MALVPVSARQLLVSFGVLVALGAGAACEFDPNKLPEPKRTNGKAMSKAEPADPRKLERASLMLASDSGNVDLIELLHENARELDWSEDGPVAMQFAARRGFIEVIRLLESYGVCGDEGEACAEALAEAEANGHAEAVAFLESVVAN